MHVTYLIIHDGEFIYSLIFSRSQNGVNIPFVVRVFVRRRDGRRCPQALVREDAKWS